MAIGKLPGSAISTATVDDVQLSANVTNKSNSAYLQANSAYNQANAAYTAANTAGLPSLNIVSTATVTAVKSNHYVLTNTSLTIVTLPAAPTSGDSVWITVANGLATNNVARNGQKIQGTSEDLTINSSNATIQMRYVNSSFGWLVG